MTKLAAWSIDGWQGEDASQQSEPKSLGRSRLGLEKEFEDWIAKDSKLIAEGLTLVGRQVSIHDGRLDLLAIDSRDRWVVIEIKPGMLYSGALSQALYYASSIAHLGADELYGKLEPGLSKFGNAEALSKRLKQQLDGEAEERDIAVMLVGAGIDPGLERMNKFLGRFGIPISVVSFEVFELDGGPQLLIREVRDEPAEPDPATAHRRLTVEAIRNQAVDAGVVKQFDRFVDLARKAGLAVQPQRASVRIAPPDNRTRFLMYARPQTGASGSELLLHVGPEAFAEFFDNIDEREAAEALHGVGGASASGEALDALLDRIERFLTDKFPQPDADGG